MKKIDDGGRAFPVPYNYVKDNGGMSLRDYFAAQCMKVYIGWLEGINNESAMKKCARTSYAMADAMLKERSKE